LLTLAFVQIFLKMGTCFAAPIVPITTTLPHQESSILVMATEESFDERMNRLQRERGRRADKLMQIVQTEKETMGNMWASDLRTCLDDSKLKMQVQESLVHEIAKVTWPNLYTHVELSATTRIDLPITFRQLLERITRRSADELAAETANSN
jgi:hypothetical protein